MQIIKIKLAHTRISCIFRYMKDKDLPKKNETLAAYIDRLDGYDGTTTAGVIAYSGVPEQTLRDWMKKQPKRVRAVVYATLWNNLIQP